MRADAYAFRYCSHLCIKLGFDEDPCKRGSKSAEQHLSPWYMDWCCFQIRTYNGMDEMHLSSCKQKIKEIFQHLVGDQRRFRPWHILSIIIKQLKPLSIITALKTLFCMQWMLKRGKECLCLNSCRHFECVVVLFFAFDFRFFLLFAIKWSWFLMEFNYTAEEPTIIGQRK